MYKLQSENMYKSFSFLFFQNFIGRIRNSWVIIEFTIYQFPSIFILENLDHLKLMSIWCNYQLSFWKHGLDACLSPWIKGKCLGSLRYLKDTGEQIFKQDCSSFGVMDWLCEL